MMFTRLTILNFGVYRGYNEFTLRPAGNSGDTRPVVLIAGQNGAGKTTILEAVRLCLYGRSALGARVRYADYEAFIRQRFNRGKEHTGEQTLTLRLEFEHTHVGIRSTYDAARTWYLEGKTLNENVSIFKDGQVLQEIAAEHWNDFLRDLIPPGVADLFFFDGEKIQALADETTSRSAMETAIRGLLNLDLIERLHSDLGNYLRQKQQQDRSNLEIRFSAAQQAYDEAEQQCKERKQDLAGLQSHLDRTLDQLDKARQALVREGASFVQQRDAQEQQQKEVERELEETRVAIRDLASRLLPFAVAPAWCMRLRERLEQETIAEKDSIAREIQQSLAVKVLDALHNTSFQQETAPQIAAHEWEQIASGVQTLIQPQATQQAIAIRHPLSVQDRDRLTDWIEMATQQTPQQLHTLTLKMEQLERTRSALTHALRQVPDTAVASPLIEKFTQLAEQKGRQQEQLGQLRQQVHQAEMQRAECERQMEKIGQELAASDMVDRRIAMAMKTRAALDDYLNEMKGMKLKEIEHEIARFFNLLCRKQSLVREVQIDPQHYTVVLYGTNRIPIPTSELSAGEKQLYAMSLLWALRSVSGRAFPIIVDTPMGRLDSEHRHAMLTRFLPQAAHQVVLLATDTEIDAEAFNTLQPAISHCYHLVFDQEQGYTEMKFQPVAQPVEVSEGAETVEVAV